ncbi:hypothetical protein NDU88_002064 [Pleurodeles waltl]|uniref:Uncharacterized protein n=1 Tax=Pleurodeles waltl TaxID=8319 RepID=A0AAV7WKB8_PLEWA|nr:hypothetical protein NDU88_002064 [Pleurodeles waltl]
MGRCLSPPGLTPTRISEAGTEVRAYVIRPSHPPEQQEERRRKSGEDGDEGQKEKRREDPAETGPRQNSPVPEHEI